MACDAGLSLRLTSALELDGYQLAPLAGVSLRDLHYGKLRQSRN